MKRLTHERASGIKSGYWSPNKKQELVDVLAGYENTGLTPKMVEELKKSETQAHKAAVEYAMKLEEAMRWIPVEKSFPPNDTYVLLSFKNFSLPMIGRYEEDENGGAFYLGDCNEEDTCSANNLFVNGWMPLPEAYCKEQKNIKCDMNCEACPLEDTDECTGM